MTTKDIERRFSDAPITIVPARRVSKRARATGMPIITGMAAVFNQPAPAVTHQGRDLKLVNLCQNPT